MKKGAKIFYDKESEVLIIEISPAKSVDSDVQGNIVIDYNKDGKITRINFYNFSFDEFRSRLKPLRYFASRQKIPLTIAR